MDKQYLENVLNKWDKRFCASHATLKKAIKQVLEENDELTQEVTSLKEIARRQNIVIDRLSLQLFMEGHK